MKYWLVLMLLGVVSICSAGNSVRVDSLLKALSEDQTGEQQYLLTLELLEAIFDEHTIGQGSNLSAPVANKVETYIQTATNWAGKAGTSQQLYQIRAAAVGHYFLESRIQEAFGLGNELLKDPQSELDTDLIVLLSEMYKFLGFYPEYIRLIPEKYKRLRAQKDPAGANYRELGDLATAYYEMQQFSRAREFYLQAISRENAPTKALPLSSFYNNIGLTFAHENRADSARFYFTKALEVMDRALSDPTISDKSYHRHFRNVIATNIAELDFETGPYEELERALLREVESGQEVKEQHIYLDAWNKLGKLKYYQKNYPEALEYLDKALPEIKALKHFSFLLFNLEWRGRILLALDRSEEANQTFALKHHLEDSLEIAQSKDRIEMAAVRFETNKKELEIQQQQLEILKGNNALAVEKERQLILAGSIVVLLLVIGFIYFIYKRVKDQKNIVSHALTQRDLMLKEIHHRVKNNLQIITSMLKSQSLQSDDKRYRELINDSQNRIKTIAMIHEKLYRTEDFRIVELQDYVGDLAKSIATTQAIKGKEVSLDLDLPERSFHIDVAVPLGLIINELITNCFKYAFENRADGRIKLSVRPGEGNTYQLEVADNGKGLPKNFNLEQSTSLGLVMVKGLAWQLNGDLKFESMEPGTRFLVTFTNQVPETN